MRHGAANESKPRPYLSLPQMELLGVVSHREYNSLSRMFRHYRNILFLILLIPTAAFASNLSWDRTEVKIDMEPDQEQVRASFNVTNNGEERVRIARVNASCGCTGSIVDRKILEPGESTEIIATFNKGKRQGLNRISLDVFIDSQPEAVATLRMNVQIPRLVDAMPQIVYWNPSSTKTARQVSITLDERYVKEIIDIDYDRTKLNVTEEEDPNGTATRILKILPKSFDTLYRGKVTIKATGKGRTADASIMVLVQP